MIEETHPLKNGAELPHHPASTTSREVVQYLKVRDAEDGTELLGGQIRGTELSMLMSGEQMSLRHLYLYTTRSGRIYHTRPSVIITVETTDADYQ